MTEIIIFHSGNPAWTTCKKAIGVANTMKKKLGEKLLVSIFTNDSEQAKIYELKASTTVIVNKEHISLDIATSEEKMGAVLNSTYVW